MGGGKGGGGSTTTVQKADPWEGQQPYLTGGTVGASTTKTPRYDADGNLVGYSDTTTFTDTAYTLGDTKTYTVSAYVNGACIGDASAAVTVKSYGDMNGDGQITVADALQLLRAILNAQITDAGLLDVLLQLRACTL